MRLRDSNIRFILLCLSLLFPLAAAAQNFDEYTRLTNHADSILEAIHSADPDNVPPLRQAAVAADLAIMNWLDGFIASDDFSSLSPEQQSLARLDRYRWEFNLVMQMLAMEHCSEAHDRIQSLLAVDHGDLELVEALRAAEQRAVGCIALSQAEQRGTLRVNTRPDGSEVSIDGVSSGTTPLDIELAPGPYVVTVEHDGYEAGRAIVTVADDEISEFDFDELVEVAPDNEQTVEVDENREPEEQESLILESPGALETGPTALDWTLWSIGVAGIATGAGLYATARDRESTVEAPPEGFHLADEANEQAIINNLDGFAIGVASVGLAAALVGTILYVTRDSGTPEEQTYSMGVDLNRGGVGLTFGAVFK